MMTKAEREIEQIEAMKAKVTELPDKTADGLDIRQAKGHATAALDNAKNQLMAVFKLAS